MALSVTITKGETYTIMCDVIDHSFTRLATQTGLPAEEEGNAPSEDGIFILDLGICTEVITLTGVVADVPTDESITRDQLEAGIRSWWAYGETSSELPKISYNTNGTQNFYGTIRNASLRRSASMPSIWEFSISFLVKSKV